MENRDWILHLGHQNTTTFNVMGALCDLFHESINIYHLGEILVTLTKVSRRKRVTYRDKLSSV